MSFKGNTFYRVVSSALASGDLEYDTYNEAFTEACEMLKLSPNTAVYIMEAITEVKGVVDITARRLEPKLPF